MAANVITALNLRIGFDVSEFETRSRDMRQSIARTKAIMRSMEGPAEKLANDVAAVTTAAGELGLEGKELELVLDKLAQKYDVTGQYARANIKANEELAAAEKKVADETKAVASALQFVAGVTERADTATGAYEKEVNRLFSDFRAGRVTLEQYQTALDAIDKHYVDAPARIKAERDAQEQLNNAHKVASKFITQEATTADQQYRVVHRALITLRDAKKLTNDEYLKSRDAAYREIVMNERVASSIDELATKHNKDAAATQERIRRYQKLNGEVKNHASATRDAARDLSGFISIYGAFAAAKAGLRVAAEMEQAQMAITVLSSSAAEGRKVFEEVRDFAAASPITFESAQKATTTLMQFGMSGQEAVEMLKMLGDASAGNSQRLEGLALAFAQSSAAGRLTGQETLQMVNQGFSPLQQMAEDMAKELGGLADDYFPSLKAAMEQGLISFDDVKNALTSATSEGGRFAGMTEAMAKTLTGNFNQARDSVARMAFQISESLKPALIEGLKLFKQLTDIVTGLFTPAESLVGTIGQFVGITITATGVIGTLIGIMKSFGMVTKAINVLLVIRNALLNPVALVAGLAIAGAAIYGMSQAVAAETAALEENADASDAAGAAKSGYAADLESATKSQLTYAEQLEKKYIDIMKPLSAQLYALRHSAEATRREELAKEGLLRDQIDNVIEVEKEIARLKEKHEIQEMFVDRAKDQLQTEKQINDALQNNMLTRKEAATKLLALEDKRLEKIKELADAGKSIQEKYNPVAKVAEQIAQLNVLLATGNITQEQFFRERNKMLFDNIKKLDMTQPEAMEAGSAQAAQFMQKMVVDEAQQQISELKAQTLLQQASLQAQQETNRRLAELKPVQLIR